MDIFSRKIVGWQVYEEESSALAGDVLRDLCLREGIQPKQLVLHSDNGSPMKGATMLATLQQLGVMPSLSRPAVSNDNPYSESLFKTLKYRPRYPLKPFAKVTDARNWVVWWNGTTMNIATAPSALLRQDKDMKAWTKIYWLSGKRSMRRHVPKIHNDGAGDTRNWQKVQAVHLNPDKAETSHNPTTKEEIQSKKAA